MAFCTNCGNPIETNSNFCKVCGVKIRGEGRDDSEKSIVSICSQCGGLIDMFRGECPSCGTKFDGLAVSKEVKELANNLSRLETMQQRISLIKVFPIPNTKEDILEYMILASSNIGYADCSNSLEIEQCEEAWMTKFIQGYQKAKLIFDNDKEFGRIQRIYDETLIRKSNSDKEKEFRKVFSIASKNVGAVCAFLVLIVAVVLNVVGQNSSFLELVTLVLLIISACSLKRRRTEYIDYGLVAAVGLLAIACSMLLSNGALAEIGGCISLIIVVVNFVKNRKND